MALGFAPIGFFPIYWLSFPVFLILLSKSKTALQATKYIWLFSFASHLSGLYWITAALFTDISTYWWAVPFALMGLPFLLAFFQAIPAYLYFKILYRKTPIRTSVTGSLHFYLAITALFWLGDYARTYLFTGFPWNLAGYSFYRSLELLQTASLIGVFGLSLLLYFSGGFIAWIITLRKTHFSKTIAGLLCLTVLFLGMFQWGSKRLEMPTQYHDNIEIQIVQQSIPQIDKWNPNLRQQNLNAQITALHEARATTSPDLTVISILPETAITWALNTSALIQRRLTKFSTDKDLIIAGSLGYFKDEQQPNKTYATNSVYFLKGDLSFSARYDKSHLVPFGEYTPIIGGDGIVESLGLGEGFRPGSGVQTQHLPNVPSVSPLICYEIIFPNKVISSKERPNWMLNLTNDGWYGQSSGPYQHFHISQMRAIEEGIPLIRSGNNGISASIDSLGRIIKYSKLNEITVLKTPLPKKIAHDTFYSKHPEAINLFLLFITVTTIILSLIILERTARKNKVK